MWAIADKHADIFHSLIEAHADVHTANAKSFTPLMIAARNGDIEMAKVLIDAGVNVNETGPDRTHVLPFAINANQATTRHGERTCRRMRQGCFQGGRQTHWLHLLAGITISAQFTAQNDFPHAALAGSLQG